MRGVVDGPEVRSGLTMFLAQLEDAPPPGEVTDLLRRSSQSRQVDELEVEVARGMGALAFQGRSSHFRERTPQQLSLLIVELD
jgi:hypothetical protein